MRCGVAMVCALAAVDATSCKLCRAVAGQADDQWCQSNCNAAQPFCPPSMCECDGPPGVPPTPQHIGYYSPSWDQGSVGPDGADIGIAFTGWVDPSSALTEYAGPVLQGVKYVSFGGGNSNGKFTADRLSSVISSIKDGSVAKAGFKGVCFDVEECDAGLSQQFADAFATAKSQGLKVFVTTSHSAPYGCPDGADLVAGWLQDSNLDFISPQMYTSGAEICADFSANDQLSWDGWKVPVASKIVPSIPYASQYPLVYQWFKDQGLELPSGFIQWAEVHASPLVV